MSHSDNGFDTIAHIYELCEHHPPSGWDKIILDSGLCKPSVIQYVKKLLRNKQSAEIYFSGLKCRIVEELNDNQAIYSEGDLIDKFRVKKPLGTGGTATVYLAERADGLIEQEVAIKVASSSALKPSCEIQAEQQLLSGLNHPNIARYFDGGVTKEGFCYIVMEYIDGLPVDAYCKAKNLKLGERLKLIMQICDAVQYAHDNRIIHKDIKPGNILVASGGRVKLVDFGVSATVDKQDGTKGRNFAYAGTLGYAAPEQLDGCDASPATDIYQMGKVFYKLVTGKDHPQYYLEEKSANSDFSFSSFAKTINDFCGKQLGLMFYRDLFAMLCKAMSDKPGERYHSAQALKNDISCILYCIPLQARNPTWIYRFGKYYRKNLAYIVPLTALAVNFCCIIALSFYQEAQNYSNNEVNSHLSVEYDISGEP